MRCCLLPWWNWGAWLPDGVMANAPFLSHIFSPAGVQRACSALSEMGAQKGGAPTLPGLVRPLLAGRGAFPPGASLSEIVSVAW